MATVLFVLLVIGFPIWDLVETPRLRAARHVEARSAYYRRLIVVEWVVAAAATAIVGFGGVYFASLGARPDWLPGPGFVLAIVAAFTVGLLVPIALLARRGVEGTPFAKQLAAIDYLLPKTRAQRLAFVLVSITAGVCEEVLFRGFTIGYLQHLPLALPIWACLLVSAAIFGLIHAGQGPAGMVSTGILGLVLGGVFLAAGNLAPAIVLHAIIDVRFALLRTNAATAS